MGFKRKRLSQNRRRRLWRRLCLPCLTVVLVLLAGLFYCQVVGLPRFLTGPLLRQLQLPGWTVEVGRLHLAPLHGIEAEGMSLRRELGGQDLSITTDSVIFGLDPISLWHWEPRINSLRVTGGDIRCPVPESPKQSTRIHFEDIATELDLIREGVSKVHFFRAQVLGAQLEIAGTVTNALAAADWGVWQPSEEKRPDWQQLGNWVRRLQALDIGQTSKVRLEWHGNAKVPASSRGRMRVTLPQTVGEWGRLGDTEITVRLRSAPDTKAGNRIEFDLRSGNGSYGASRWQRMQWTGTAAANITKGHLSSAKTRLLVTDFRSESLAADQTTLSTSSVHGQSPGDAAKERRREWFRTHLEAEATGIEVPKGGAQSAQLDLKLRHSMQPRTWKRAWRELKGKLALDRVRFRADKRVGKVDAIAVDITGKPQRENDLPRAPQKSELWQYLAPYHLEADVDLTGLTYPNLIVDTAEASFNWNAPTLTLSKLKGTLYNRSVQMAGNVNLTNRQVRVGADFDFNLHRIAPLLPKDVQRDLKKFTWESPPEFHATAESVIPDWNGSRSKWVRSLVGNTRIKGKLSSGSGSFEGIPFSKARSHFRFSEFRWHLPNLVVKRPEGRLDIDYQCDIKADYYALQVNGQIFAKALQPLFNGDADEFFAPLNESKPAEVTGKVYGPFDKGKGGIDGRITLPDVRYRGEQWERVSSQINYTNRYARLRKVALERNNHSLHADRIDWDLESPQFQFINLHGRGSPYSLARMVNTNLSRRLEPFQFSSPPELELNGSVQLPEKAKAKAKEKAKAKPDIQLTVKGKELQAWRLKLVNPEAKLLWKNDDLTVTNLTSDFYRGKLRGNGEFSFAPEDHIDLRFESELDRVNLKALMGDAYPGRHRLLGELTTEIVVTSARTDAWQSWQGYGNVTLEDGLIWDIPIFGILSTPLNKISPGLGNSRADRATASFTLENGVIHTQDLEIRGPAFGLNYKGEIDLRGNVEARAKAVLLEDMVVVGPLVNLAMTPFTELFVYHITGTVEEPNAEPLYIFPKLMLLPFKPFRDLQKLFPG